MRYELMSGPSHEFSDQGIPLGRIYVVAKVAESRNIYRVQFYHLDEEKQDFDTLDEAKEYVEGWTEKELHRWWRNTSTPALTYEQMYIQEKQMPWLKEIIIKLARKEHLELREMEIVLAIAKEIGGPSCPDCEGNKVRKVADSILWCEDCEAHVEV
jgi:hypothetical protein